MQDVLATADSGLTDRSDRSVGLVVLVKGAQAVLQLQPTTDFGGNRAPTVGSLIGIRGAQSRVVGLVSEVSAQREGAGEFQATVDLVGELPLDGGFRRGVTHYPLIGDGVQLLHNDDVAQVYRSRDTVVTEVGTLHNHSQQPACVNVRELLAKHFAVVGTTGVGKSSGVAVLLNALLVCQPDLRVFLIDAHNEYGSCFNGRSIRLTPNTFRLPFWLFNFDEFLELVFRGRTRSDEEVEILSDLIPEARRLYASSNRDLSDSGGNVAGSISVDTPVPYRMSDLCRLVEDRMGRLEHKAARGVHSKLLRRLVSVSRDARYSFVFDAANVGGDTMVSVLKQVFPPPSDGHRMTIMQLAGIPSEATNAVVSVLGRMAFDFGLWSDGALPLLFVCEEAHRYAPAHPKSGFVATQRSIARIAKEGRKYGVYLGLVSQRPAELDQTILSQCSTFFVMRLANDADQAIIRAAVSDAGATLLDFVPSLGPKEVFAFGEGVRMPTRLEWTTLPPDRRPRAEAGGIETEHDTMSESFYDDVVARWRGSLGVDPVDADQKTGDRRSRPLDPARYRLLKHSVAVGG